MNIATHGLHLPAPVIERVRHELRRRALTVRHVERVTPAMLRIVAGGEDLADFVSSAPDDHIKVIVPGPAGEEMRDYTPRRFDAARGELTIDFAVHEAGPATAWAMSARVGDRLTIAGPRGSAVVTGDIRNWLLIGDETALPAIGRRIEETPAGVPVTSLLAVAGPEDEQSFETPAQLTALWVHRPLAAATEAAPFLAALEAMTIAPGTFVWIAAEASVMRAVRGHLTGTRGVPSGWIKAAGYWVMGRADAHEKG